MPGPARNAAPEAGRLQRPRRAYHGHRSAVGLQLAEQVVGRGAAVDRELGQRRRPASRVISVDDVAHLERDRLQGRAREVRAGGAAGDAEDRAAGVRVPVRRAEPGQRRHEDDAAGVGHGARQRLDLGSPSR